MKVSGVIEGFYGPPWSHEERLDLIRFCGREGLDTWVHAPKHDPYHRRRWREPYPDAELERLGELAGEAKRRGLARMAARIEPPSDVASLAAALEPGVDAPTALALLEPFT